MNTSLEASHYLLIWRIPQAPLMAQTFLQLEQHLKPWELLIARGNCALELD